MSVEPTVGLALLAGLVSFMSPCVLPLVPAYVGYMSGHATQAAGQTQRNQFGTFLHGVFFVLGFTIFFVGFGLITAAASDFLDSIGIDIPQILTRLGGVAVIVFGLYVMRVLDPLFSRGLRLAEDMKEDNILALMFTSIVLAVFFVYYLWAFELIIPTVIFLALTILLFQNQIRKSENLGDFWYRTISAIQNAMASDTRQLNNTNRGQGYPGSLFMGLVFAAGWTPCIGPIYGSVLTLASTSAANGESLFPAATMLTAYSLGLGIPFLIAALALNQMTGVMKGLKRNMRKIEYASGILLILIGLLILTGGLEDLSAQFGTGELGDFSFRLEECTAGAASGRIGVGSWPGCIAEGEPKLSDRLIFASFDPSSGAEIVPLFEADPNFNPDDLEVGIQVGQLAPDFTTVTPEGDPISLSDFEGEVVLLNFWATWCGPCRQEMPEFQTFFERYDERGFNVLAVDFLEPSDVVIPFVEELGLTFDIAMDESGEINDTFQVPGYPTSILVDGNGVILERHTTILTGEQLQEMLDSIDPLVGSEDDEIASDA